MPQLDAERRKEDAAQRKVYLSCVGLPPHLLDIGLQGYGVLAHPVLVAVANAASKYRDRGLDADLHDVGLLRGEFRPVRREELLR